MQTSRIANTSTFLGQPRGLATLFFTEMWERFSYYGMRALLILFMTGTVATGGLGFDVETAGIIYGLCTAAAYLTALPGGWLADRIVGHGKAILYGGALIATGNALLAIPGSWTFYLGMLFVVSGTGLLKPNVSTMVGQLYAQDDIRRDAGFSVFYMGINLGALLAPLICGYLGTRFSWRFGFAAAAVGMTIGLIQFWWGQRHLPAALSVDYGHQRSAVWRGLMGAGLLVLLVGTAVVAMRYGVISLKDLADASGAMLIGIVVLFFVWLLTRPEWSTIERRRLAIVAILFLASVIFWSVFEQAGSSMNLFAQRNTDNALGHFSIPAPWYQSINAVFIITLAPVFALLWQKLGKREPSSAAKFSIGLVWVGFGFLILATGAVAAEAGSKVSPLWLLATYMCHTVGELCLSPVGLSAMTKLAPARVSGVVMGAWFMSISAGNYIGGRIAALYEAFPLYILFGASGLVAASAGLVLALLVRPVRELKET